MTAGPSAAGHYSPTEPPHTPPAAATDYRDHDQSSSASNLAPPGTLVQQADLPPSPTPTPTGPSHLLTAMRNRAISPPTPAPSPQPHGQRQRLYSSLAWSSQSSDSTAPKGSLESLESEDVIIQAIRDQVGALSGTARQRLLALLISDSPPSALSPLLPLIAPRLKRDFLKTLPIELAYHVLSFVDDVKTLARASMVSRFWRDLLEDEGTWRRMCWRRGFGDLETGIDGTATPFSKIKHLEFGEREDDLYTPAGRERRGTLERASLLQFAARAESFGLRANMEGDDMAIDGELRWQNGSGFDLDGSGSPRRGSTGLGIGASVGTEPASLKARRASALMTANSPMSGYSGSQQRENLASPPLRPFPGDTPSASPASEPVTRPSSSSRKTVSYKTHFKRAYLTESAWLRGPGRLLSTQMSSEDGVVTSLGFDNDWIVVGMATSKIHVFDANNGHYSKTLEGHELGVWCLTLVTRGGGPRKTGTKLANRMQAESLDSAGRNYALDDTASLSGASPPLQRRRSFQGFTSAGAAATGPATPGRSGGMGLGAGGETGDGSHQSSVCGTSRGWGQEHSIVVSGGCDRAVRVWDADTGPIAVSGSRDSTLRVWNIETGEAIHQLVGHEHSVRCIDVHGDRVVSGSYDSTCRLWDLSTGQCLQVLQGHQHQIYAVAFDGIRIVTGSLDSTVRVWSAETGQALALLQGHTSLVGQVQIDPVSNILVTGGSDGRVIVFSLSSFERIHGLCAHDNSVTCLQFDERFIVTGGNDGRIKLWDFKTGAYIRELAEPCDSVWRAVFRDDKCVTLCQRDGKTLLEVKTFRPSDKQLHGVASVKNQAQVA
ncbi:hypothetical protein OIV83_004401 [Microbotryomycetes sp. JL201]|nr:hypothetical protein OIV83_004401 [Microbotryomycetes sp. JL201]